MKKNLLLSFITILLSQFCSAQNLVPNPSFEEYITCPDNAGQIDRTTGWFSADNTPDYFNTCALGYNWCTIPLNYFGYRTPASGNAYAGIIARWAYTEELKESIATALIAPLQTGIKYYASFKVSLAGGNSVYCGINKLGILFSTENYNTVTHVPLCNGCAQISTDSIITDTLNWTRIIGSFIADSNYSYINVGRFNFNDFTDSIQIAGNGCNAYYYVDDVCVSADSLICNLNTSVADFREKQEITIYPNPANQNLYVLPNTDTYFNYSLMNSLGNIVHQGNAKGKSSIDVSDFMSGLYFLEIRLPTHSIHQRQLIIH